MSIRKEKKKSCFPNTFSGLIHQQNPHYTGLTGKHWQIICRVTWHSSSSQRLLPNKGGQAVEKKAVALTNIARHSKLSAQVSLLPGSLSLTPHYSERNKPLQPHTTAKQLLGMDLYIRSNFSNTTVSSALTCHPEPFTAFSILFSLLK